MAEIEIIKSYDDTIKEQEEEINKKFPNNAIIEQALDSEVVDELLKNPTLNIKVVKQLQPKPNPQLDLRIRFTHHEGHLVIQFSHPIANMKLTYKDARELARRIVKETLK